MIDKIRDYFARSIYAIPVVTAVFVLCGFMGIGAYYLLKKQPELENNNRRIEQEQVVADEPEIVDNLEDVPKEVVEEIKKTPPSTKSDKISSKSVSTNAGTAVVVSTASGGVSDSKIQDYANSGPTSNFSYIDNTGVYPNLGNTIKDYLNTKLLKGGEISFLYELSVIDCASCNYGGYWTGSYIYSGSDIIKAFGYITLNVAPYKSSPYFEDYMKIIFAHEYGHHYTMYHRWVKLDIPTGERFPASYYSVRPLSYNTTAPDYSLGWSYCDAEVLAEDYSYFYSGYGYHGMASIHGYPSVTTKSWLIDLSGTTPPIENEPIPEPDSSPPSVALISPSNNETVSGRVNISATASDNVAVSRVDFLLNNNLISSVVSSPYQLTWDSTTVSNGSYTIRARAYDTTNNSNTTSISIVINNTQSSDTSAPVVLITAPTDNPYLWLSDNLQISASATDNVGVVKIEFYINNSLVATENSSIINRIWLYSPTPNDSYQLKAKAYDAAGNFGEVSATINKL